MTAMALRSKSLVLALLCVAPLLQADERGFVLPNSRVESMESPNSDVEYEIRVWVPQSYESDDRNYPLIVMLDADYSFPVVSGMLEHLAQRGQAEDAIIVAVGYTNSGSDPYWYRRNRTRDYTPSHSPQGGYGPEFQAYSGGGPAFLAFLSGQLIPYIERNYRTDASARTFIGHSYGGLFGAFVLSEQPALFSRYLLVSPSLWYDEKRMLDGDKFEKLRALDKRTEVYLAVGAFENQAGRRMIDELESFRRLLDDIAAIETEIRIFEGETHASVFPVAVSTGLRYFFHASPSAAATR